MNWNGHEPQLVNPNILSCKASSAPPSPWWRHLNKSQLTCDSTEHISTNNNKYIVYIYIYIRVTSDPATSKRAKMFIKTAPYHHDYSWLPLIWGIGHIQPVKAALINCRLFSRQLSPTAAKETAGRLQLDHWWSMHVFRIISSRFLKMWLDCWVWSHVVPKKRLCFVDTARTMNLGTKNAAWCKPGLDQCLRMS